MKKLFPKILWISLGLVSLLILLAMFGPSLSTGGLTIGSITKAGRPIISAIQKYQADHRQLPTRLTHLVPHYHPPLQEITYYKRRYASWPHILLFGRPKKTHWIYKTTTDTQHFALGIDENNHTAHYNSQTGQWSFEQDQAFRNYGQQ